MKTNWMVRNILIAMVMLPCGRAFGHCDALDGPVVKAAEKALASGSASHVLIWVEPRDEEEIKQAFEKALAVRKLGHEAKELADRYFFETLVRVHRAGEGAPFTGLKAAGEGHNRAIEAADQAIKDGDIGPLAKATLKKVNSGLREHFAKVVAAKKFDPSDVEAGRRYVKAYVEYIHHVERVHEAADRDAHAQPSDHANH